MSEFDNLAKIEAWLDHTKAISDYRLNVRALVRGLWNGSFSYFSFVDDFTSAITRNLRGAWAEGAATCGIREDELTNEEIAARDRLISDQFPYLLGFADAIEANSRASGGLLGPLLQRAELWIRRYDEAKERGKAMACADSKGIWRVGPTEHCSSCAGFNGRVYRFSTWEANGALPRTRVLCCKGYRCQCTIERTTERITPGPFPRGLLCG